VRTKSSCGSFVYSTSFSDVGEPSENSQLPDVMHIPTRVYLVAAGLALGVVLHAQSPVSRTSGSRVVSPTVVATTIIEYSSPDRAELQLLVLWRGAPGWFTNGGGSGSGSGQTSGGPLLVNLSYGRLSFTLSFDAAAHRVAIQNMDVPLGPDDNVILLDAADGGGGPQVVGTLHV
jgi:hypothetical protein